MNQGFHHPQFDDGDLIENLDIDNLNHAEKFLLATTSRIDGVSVELICGNGNRWRLPDNHVNHGNVVCAYIKLREAMRGDAERRLAECRAALLDIATTSSSTRIRKLAERTLINTTPKP